MSHESQKDDFADQCSAFMEDDESKPHDDDTLDSSPVTTRLKSSAKTPKLHANNFKKSK
jgi:hypothetical protein